VPHSQLHLNALAADLTVEVVVSWRPEPPPPFRRLKRVPSPRWPTFCSSAAVVRPVILATKGCAGLRGARGSRSRALAMNSPSMTNRWGARSVGCTGSLRCWEGHLRQAQLTDAKTQAHESLLR